jgi:ribosomal-protein-alanine N-acetyltransferase
MVYKSHLYGGFVITDLKEPVGYVIYRRDTKRKRLLVLSMVIHPDYQRQGLGTALVNKLKTKLRDRFRYIAWVVRESNLAGHLFLKSQGFQAVEVVKNHFVDYFPDVTEHEDGYAFVYKEES